LLAESAQYADGIGIGHTTTRNYSYDSLGRGNRVDTTIAEAGGFNRSYTERTTFDQYGRVFQAFDAAGGGRGTRQVYNSRGYLARIRESRGGVNGEVYWTVLAQDARGQVTEAELGNGTRLLASFDAATGRLLHKVDSTGRALAQDLELVWDAIGNLTERDARSGLADQLELFQYDVRDRLTRVQRAVNGGAPGTVQQLRYDLSGNILCKSDVSASSCTGTATNYSYASSKPHAVTSAGPRTLVYDANGNVILDRHNGITDRQFHYTTYDQLRRVSRGGQQVEFHYGANRARTLKRELEGGQIARRTHYVGAVEVVWEGSSPPVGAGEYRRMIGGVALATYHAASGVERVRYLHTDHLGSIVAISDENGLIESRTGFDAWGQRRDGADWSQVWQQWLFGITPAWAAHQLEVTPRGYTGHEHVDAMGLIHMNGRIYDALLGRFLQADPFVEDSTTLNRYTYVHNNPLAYTDPSGYFSFKKFVKTVASVAITAFAPQLLPFASFVNLAAAGAVAGFIATGSVEGALFGAFSAAVFHGIGQGFANLPADSALRGDFLGSKLSAGGLALKSIAHAATGGVLSSVQGGKFVHGFAAAGVTQFASGGIDLIGGEGFSPLRVAAAAVLGGTVSEISGGKFANGATTAAMAFAFNQLQSDGTGRMTKSEAVQQARDLNQSGSNRRWTAIQLDDGTWNVMQVDNAAQRAAGLNPETGGVASASGNLGAGGFLGLAGVSVSGGPIFDTHGNACFFYSVCIQAGLGIGVGAGLGAGLSVSEVEPGISTSHGPFGFGGTGLFGSGSLDFSSGGSSVDFFGPGIGAGGGYQWCVQNNVACR